MVYKDNVVKDAIEFKKPFGDLEAQLSSFSWDYDDAPVFVTRGDLKNVLSRFLQKELTADDVHHWADFLELRDDVDFLSHDSDLLPDMMHSLANPYLEGKLTEEKAAALIKILE